MNRLIYTISYSLNNRQSLRSLAQQTIELEHITTDGQTRPTPDGSLDVSALSMA